MVGLGVGDSGMEASVGSWLTIDILNVSYEGLDRNALNYIPPVADQNIRILNVLFQRGLIETCIFTIQTLSKLISKLELRDGKSCIFFNFSKKCIRNGAQRSVLNFKTRC